MSSSPEQVDPQEDEDVIQGSCFCGGVSYEVYGTPVLSAFCHCTKCQRMTGCPFVHTIHYDASAFAWTHPGFHLSRLDSYNVPEKPWKTRYRCKQCGCTVASHNAKTSHWSVWGAQLQRGEDGKIMNWEKIKPTAHIFYGTRMMDVHDDLGKWEGYEGTSPRIIQPWSGASPNPTPN
ncbi:hypothetical protein GLOTRDRAFT_67467 [Gloeophyllum trabeum ATCC 11539]|uniref:CENP-V/GFA domain-containing protein n=1 Tax=Gloeophyllum trabeum (strain ATCC 11539 / FP-39264 / Madison 617) TaxID=670483 RepID=S7QLC2_GLOTA|nr:uncharacterized protein GLOTRDRAFT_67467 [Gloeophyllum trabeum ATCC 11539]EPQ60112.1 hypothetical protein GLOTRDRAFT_67467 [Gloeophyllum trabeum ATCC 11539]